MNAEGAALERVPLLADLLLHQCEKLLVGVADNRAGLAGDLNALDETVRCRQWPGHEQSRAGQS